MQYQSKELSAAAEGEWVMVDADLGVVASALTGFPRWVKELFAKDTSDDIESLAFFYHPGLDLIILNKDHFNADFYELLVTHYLAFDEENRKRVKEEVPVDVIGTALDLLDFVIKERDRINGRFKVPHRENADCVSG